MRYTTIGSGSLSARKVSVLSLGAMRFGTTTDEATSLAILDQYVARAGIDNYVLGTARRAARVRAARRWRSSRGIGDEIVIATKAT